MAFGAIIAPPTIPAPQGILAATETTASSHVVEANVVDDVVELIEELIDLMDGDDDPPADP